MAPLAHTLALLTMAMATSAVTEVPMDMAPNSFDDQYKNCSTTMTTELSALNRSEFQKNQLFAQVWVKAEAEWQRRGSPGSPLLNPPQAIALMAYTMDDLYSKFNDAVRTAGSSSQEYRNNFDFKTLHFLLTQAVVTLKGTQRPQKENCPEIPWQVCGVHFIAQEGDTVRFGQFMSTSVSRPFSQCAESATIFLARTCLGAEIQGLSYYPSENDFLIPPFETFKVIKAAWDGSMRSIVLESTGTKSNYDCEWLKGGSVPKATFHLGGLLLATTALAVATGIL